MQGHLEDDTDMETDVVLLTLATFQQSRVASKSTSRMYSELAWDPPEEDATVVSSKRTHRNDGQSTPLEDRKKQRADILARYCALYRLNHLGSGVFTLNLQNDNTLVHDICLNMITGPFSYYSPPRHLADPRSLI
jgi:hypothetical protein